MTNLPFIGVFNVTQEYGRKGSYAAGYHTGIDLVGKDKIVYNVCDGIVTLAKYYGSYGNCVKVRDNTTRKIYLFAHLESIAVKVGQKVNRASKLGIMGNSGNSRGTHLHFEVRTPEDVYGKQENPAIYLGIPNKVGQYNSENYQLSEKEIYDIKYKVYCQNIGWQEPSKENGQLAGTEGQALRIEAIKIDASENIKYRVHMENKGNGDTKGGWSEYVPNGFLAGTMEESRRIECIEIETSKTPIKATAHIQNIGTVEYAPATHLKIGTEGKALRLEALTLKFV